MAAIFESFFQMAKLIIALHQLYTTPAMTCKNDVNFRFRLYIYFAIHCYSLPDFLSALNKSRYHIKFSSPPLSTIVLNSCWPTKSSKRAYISEITPPMGGKYIINLQATRIYLAESLQERLRVVIFFELVICYIERMFKAEIINH